MVEDKQRFLNKLTVALQDTALFGNEKGNRLTRMELITDQYGCERVRPIFEDGLGEDGDLDINVNNSSCLAMIGDIYEQFIQPWF